jgi:ferrous iron transport protein A
MIKVDRMLALKAGETAIITGISAEAGLQQRLLAMGFRTGKSLVMLRKAWLNGPMHVRIGTTEVMVRRRDAHAIRLSQFPAEECQ